MLDVKQQLPVLLNATQGKCLFATDKIRVKNFLRILCFITMSAINYRIQVPSKIIHN